MHTLSGTTFTKYGWLVCFWSLIIPFQHGYHISVLNQIQGVLTCKGAAPPIPESISGRDGLAICIPMSDLTFSLITSIYTVGGLAGSLVANIVMDRWGRRGANRISALLITVFTAITGLSSSIPLLLISRFTIGIASGLGLCVGPIYLSEIAPSRIRGSVGILTQLAIVSGVMGTQIAGINLASPSHWRFVFLVSFFLSSVQLLSSSMVVESPAFLLTQQRPEDHKAAAQRLWGSTASDSASDQTSLLSGADDEPRQQQETVSVPQLLVKPELRGPLMTVSLAMIAQQISGVTAVFYYSNDLLAKSLPQLGAHISLSITVINVLMTFPPIFLIERMGRKTLLATSILGAMLSLIAVGFALDSGLATIASIAIVTFVMFYAIGLGPIPFVMIPEVSPPHAVSALSSVALSLSWSTSFVVGLVFLPIRNVLSGGDMYKEGRVFYVFGLLFCVASILLLRFYK